MGQTYTETTEPLRRQVAYVCGRWRVTYLWSAGSDQETEVRGGLLVGPLTPDPSTTIWVAVVPDGSTQRTMIRRDSITAIAPPGRSH